MTWASGASCTHGRRHTVQWLSLFEFSSLADGPVALNSTLSVTTGFWHPRPSLSWEREQSSLFNAFYIFKNTWTGHNTTLLHTSRLRTLQTLPILPLWAPFSRTVDQSWHNEEAVWAITAANEKTVWKAIQQRNTRGAMSQRPRHNPTLAAHGLSRV